MEELGLQTGQEKRHWMERALQQAQLAYDKEEVPVGAVLVRGGELIACAHNEVERSQDACSHAELNCMREAACSLRQWRLTGCTLYCTLEPCLMCYGAMIHFRLSHLVWGAPDLRHGALGSLYDLRLRPHPIHRIEEEGPFMAEACGELMRQFFRKRRQLSKEEA